MSPQLVESRRIDKDRPLREHRKTKRPVRFEPYTVHQDLNLNLSAFRWGLVLLEGSVPVESQLWDFGYRFAPKKIS